MCAATRSSDPRGWLMTAAQSAVNQVSFTTSWMLLISPFYLRAVGKTYVN